MKLKFEYEHVHFERSTKTVEPVAWFCYTPDGKLSLGKVVYSKEYHDYVYTPDSKLSLGKVQYSKEHHDYVRCQIYEAILTEEQLRDIARFIKGIRARWI